MSALKRSLFYVFRNAFTGLYKMTPAKIIALGFAFLIFFGGVLLSLPISSRTGEFTPLLKSMFTATSATCVTGLIVFDTYTHWSAFGQAVILMLIQIGGLGFMTVGATASFIIGRTISLKERIIMSEALNQDSLSGIVRMTRHIIFGTIALEALGAVLLSFAFVPQFGFWDGVAKGIFHSVSAFCNAGFDLMGEVQPFSSLTAYVGNPLVNITIMALVVIGGLGFYVWEDVLNRKKLKKFSLHTKVTFIMTAILLVGGAVLFYAFEHNNPNTMGALSGGEKAWASMFMSVTPRTAGYNTIDIAALSPVSKFFTSILMFIGGSPGSTAGGVKTVTLAVLLLAVIATIRGKGETTFLRRKISVGVIMRAMTVVTIAIFIVGIGIIVLATVENAPFADIVLEVVSAFATVGLSASLTPTLSPISLATLIFIMYAGRIGVMTFLVALVYRQKSANQLVSYPEGRIIVG